MCTFQMCKYRFELKRSTVNASWVKYRKEAREEEKLRRLNEGEKQEQVQIEAGNATEEKNIVEDGEINKN